MENKKKFQEHQADTNKLDPRIIGEKIYRNPIDICYDIDDSKKGICNEAIEARSGRAGSIKTVFPNYCVNLKVERISSVS